MKYSSISWPIWIPKLSYSLIHLAFSLAQIIGEEANVVTTADPERSHNRTTVEYPETSTSTTLESLR